MLREPAHCWDPLNVKGRTYLKENLFNIHQKNCPAHIAFFNIKSSSYDGHRS